MAFVYEATDLKHGRQVAIKALKPEVASQVGGERFLREIRIVSRLSHPNIMPLHESGEVNGVVYYVMPLVTGENLGDRLERTPALTLDEKLRIFREVAQALAYSHQQGVIHRDLKPDNIMLSGGVAVVADFGIARAPEVAGSATLTQVGFSVGTPMYMSPEQATAESMADARSDIYSLGCILYEMLSGETPYDGPSSMAVIARHLSEPVPDLAVTHPEIPANVAQSVRRAMAKSPDQRFQSVDEFVRALDIGAQIRSPTRPAPRPTRRRTFYVAALVSALTLAGIAGAVFTRRNAHTATIPRLAVLPFEHLGAPDQAYFTAGITDEVSNRIAEVSGISVVSRTSAMQFTLARNTLKEIAEKLHVDYLLVGVVRTDKRADATPIVRVTPKLVTVASGREIPFDELDAALVPGEIFTVQATIARRVAAALNIALSPEAVEALAIRPTTNLQAYNAYLRGIFHATQFLVRQQQVSAIEELRMAVQLDPQFALAFARLAQVQSQFYTVFERTPQRLQLWKDALDQAVAIAPTLAQTMLAQAQWLFYAKKDPQRAMAIIDEVRSRQPSNTDLLWLLARVQRTQGDFTGALKSFDAVAALDPRSAIFPFESGTVLFMLRRFPETKARLDLAAQLSPDWLAPKATAPRVAQLLGHSDEARTLFEAMLPQLPALLPQFINEPLYRDFWDSLMPAAYQDALARSTLESTLSDTAEYYHAKASLYRRRDMRGLQHAYADSAVRVLSGRRASGATGLFLLVDLGDAYLSAGNVAAASAYADSARAGAPMTQDAFRGWFASIEIARLYARVGATDKALALLEQMKAAGREVPAPMLRDEPRFAAMSSEPRMQALLAAK